MKNSTYEVLAKNRYSTKVTNLKPSKEPSLQCRCRY